MQHLLSDVFNLAIKSLNKVRLKKKPTEGDCREESI